MCDKMSFSSFGSDAHVFAFYEDQEIAQWISYKGNFIADLGSIICDEPARFNIQALTCCECYTIDKKDYLNLPQVFPRWPMLERLLITRCFRFMETRIFALLSMSAEGAMPVSAGTKSRSFL